MQTYKPHANETRHAGIGSNAKQAAHPKGRKNQLDIPITAIVLEKVTNLFLRTTEKWPMQGSLK